MRAAPPVAYPLARHGAWARLAAGLAGLAAAGPIAWLAWHLHVARVTSPAIDVLLVPLVLAAALGAARVGAWLASRTGGCLRWDGTAWELLAASGVAARLASPSVRIDLGRAMLLRAPVPGARARWLAVERGDSPAAWHGLRVALAQPSRARRATVPTAGGTT
ncbi:hypothetical protein [Ideonella sp.]|uniref:hypothetical protein n=1 Tax=Ideonella sp. TaxID=1929293 RepID=UPI002B49C6DC|nr:hypothetical protein [Ideonella sp.]HJV69365.1 hypothetical protein [Ideonella sp.]